MCVCVCLIFCGQVYKHILKTKKTDTKNHPIPRHPGPPPEVWVWLDPPKNIPKVWMLVHLPTWMVDFHEINVGKYQSHGWYGFKNMSVFEVTSSTPWHHRRRIVAHLKGGRPYCHGRFWCFGTNLQRWDIWTMGRFFCRILCRLPLV